MIDYWHGYKVNPRKPERCPRCGGVLLYDRWDGIDDEWDEELAAAHGVYEWKPGDPQSDAFTYIIAEYECSCCGRMRPYGRRWYYDATTNSYTSDSPLKVNVK